ncbi:hypothetical protein Ctha_1501 [Chloroherpeton thalassium ATCC 35110]|uniref:Uncharacterized protein n=1 Tax=Chloroherpeton thalassium (strain ATCC 35110 / GB-78) TaxID=517418 RepID=B3QS15_CHLT3|nr:hypothetical protein Ctha_1501 [Chloroherpeton thalassium ATCC 35110]
MLFQATLRLFLWPAIFLCVANAGAIYSNGHKNVNKRELSQNREEFDASPPIFLTGMNQIKYIYITIW